MTKIFIATPTSRDACSMQYTLSITAIIVEFSKKQIRCAFEGLDNSDLPIQRDQMADKFLRSDCTHLLFIDSDNPAAPDLGLDLLAADKELIGAAYPKRTFDFQVLKANLARGLPFENAVSASYEFSVVPLSNGTVERQGDLFRVGGVGMGFTLIRRSCFDKLAAAYGHTFHKMVDGTTMRGLFDPIKLPEQRTMLREDLSFCRRFTDIGGEVWALSTATKIGHIGPMMHRASFADHVEARRSPPQTKA